MEVPRDITIAVVAGELPAADAYAVRHGWRLNWEKEDLALFAEGIHPADKTPVRWKADVTSYRALPPVWSCFQGEIKEEKLAWKPRFPKGGTLPGGVGSIFHSAGLICAPFNRLAFAQHSGPHSDWGGPADWLKVRGKVRATTLAEMIAQIVVDLTYSPGWH